MDTTQNSLNNSIIFALNTGENQAENTQEARNLRRTLVYHGLNPLDLVVGEGCYGGSIEQCYVYPYSPWAFTKIYSLARAHAQESILHVNGLGDAVLYFCDAVDYLDAGTMVQVGACEAQKSEGYTKIGDTYYTIKEMT